MKDIEKDVDSWMCGILESSNKPVFTKITLDEKTAKQYNLLSKIKIGPEYKGIIYLDNDNVIGYANVTCAASHNLMVASKLYFASSFFLV